MWADKEAYLEERGFKGLSEALLLVWGRVVVDVKPVQMSLCKESYPCQGHQGVRIYFKDTETPTVCFSCSQNSC